MAIFKQGDKVVCMDDDGSLSLLKKGAIYTVDKRRTGDSPSHLRLEGVVETWWESRFELTKAKEKTRIHAKGFRVAEEKDHTLLSVELTGTQEERRKSIEKVMEMMYNR